MVFLVVWMLVVYFPLAHRVWGVDGFASADINPNLNLNLKDIVGKSLRMEQLKAIGFTLSDHGEKGYHLADM